MEPPLSHRRRMQPQSDDFGLSDDLITRVAPLVHACSTACLSGTTCTDVFEGLLWPSRTSHVYAMHWAGLLQWRNRPIMIAASADLGVSFPVVKTSPRHWVLGQDPRTTLSTLLIARSSTTPLLQAKSLTTACRTWLHSRLGRRRSWMQLAGSYLQQ